MKNIDSKTKCRNSKGFTLVEAVVVMALIAILIAFSAAGIIQYRKQAEFMRNNEYAQTIFTAAQSYMTKAKANGTLEDLDTLMKKEASSQIVPGDVVDNGPTVADGHTLYYLLWSVEDYKDKTYEKPDNQLQKAFYEILRPYLYDKGLLNASVALEFDPADGVVYSVCYSNHAKSFTYDSTPASGEMSILQREEKVRKEILLGYYGTDLLDNAPSARERPVIQNLELVNKETLDLRFRMNAKYRSATGNLKYNIIIVDSDKNPLLKMTINDKKTYTDGNGGAGMNILPSESAFRAEEESGEQNYTLWTEVSYLDPDAAEAEQWKKAVVKLRAYVTPDKLVCVTLDAADLKAAEIFRQKPDALGEEYKETYSIKRFNIMPQTIMAKVTAGGNNYINSHEGISNEANSMIADGSVTDVDGNKTINGRIENGRHLFNMRFTEKEWENKTVAYKIEPSFDWAGDKGIIANKKLFNGMQSVAYDKTLELDEQDLKEDMEKIAFPSIAVLAKNHTLTGEKKSEIKNLVITPVKNTTGTGTDFYDIYQNTLGLFQDNQGTIENVILNHPIVLGSQTEGGTTKGIDKVGALCGTNSGKIDNVEVKKGKVTGKDYVAGIAGQDNGKAPAGSTSEDTAGKYTGCKNSAEILGRSYVGGILGATEAKEENPSASEPREIQMKNCTNTGAVRSVETANKGEAKASEGNYIGGIIGHSEVGIITSCKSAPSLKASNLTYEELSKLLKGNYVGGIAGYNKGGTISQCETTGGTIVGGNYVGGIVGFNEGSADNGENTIEGEGKTNSADVAGIKYVGGIVGANASRDDEGNLTNDYNAKNIVKGWTNKGLITAVEGYSGGITGYNAGDLVNCNAGVDTSSRDGKVLLDRAKEWAGVMQDGAAQANCDYAGGLVGYNNGQIQSGNNITRKVVSVVAGNNYVGGLIGYNDTQGYISNYNLHGGYVSGNGFVGGFAGCNTAAGLFSNYMVSSPNYVEGNYFLGGLIGGNLVGGSNGNEESVNEISLKADADNFLGNIKGRDNDLGIYVGGLVGYNAIMDWTSISDTATVPTGMLAIAENEEEKVTWYTRTENLNEYLTDYVPSNLTMEISGANLNGIVSSNERKNELSRIEGHCYVGGIMGYNQQNSQLQLTEIVNKTPVIALGTTSDGGKYGNINIDSTLKTYSYAGGIIGVNSGATTLDNCSNDGSATIDSMGTYMGALTEVNEGTITNCAAASVGDNTRSYVGGITGVNGYWRNGSDVEPGQITDCTITGTITGSSNVGGFAADNYGIIEKSSFGDGAMVWGNGYYVGGFTGRNMASESEEDNVQGSIKINETTGLPNINVSGSGTNVGGLTGGNQGTITADDNVVYGESSVYGTATVGGIIGLQEGGGEIGNLQNHGTVTASDGDAGGILGGAEFVVTKGEIKYTIRDCENHSSVTTQNSGNAGGIMATNAGSGTITDCVNYGSITSGNGSAGGIVSQNEGIVEDSRVEGEGGKKLSITAKENLGGLCGENCGTIQNSSVSSLDLTTLVSGGATNLGGLAGINETGGTIKNCSGNTVELRVNSGGNNVGGLAGSNAGTLEGSMSTAVFEKITITSGEYNANLGGIAGINTGSISGYDFRGTIEGASGTDYGYGGIVGDNEKGQITGCTFAGRCSAQGSQDTITNIGGIAGINQEGAVIENSYPVEQVGDKATTVQGVNAYVGGVAGHNYGTVHNIQKGSIQEDGRNKDIDNALSYEHKDTATVQITTGKGHTGGIVGLNEVNGQVSEVSTGTNWAIYATEHATDNAVGGIIGYNLSGGILSKVQNLALIYKTIDNDSVNSVAGIVGRWENTTGASWLMDNCQNRGSVYGPSRVGGMIGQWKYTSGTLKDCVNYGNIYVKGGKEIQGVSGMIGHVYEVNAGSTLRFDGCRNEGNLINTLMNNMENNKSKKPMAGFVASTNVDSNSQFIFQDCVNAGTIVNKNQQYMALKTEPTQNAGFVASDAAKSTYTYCRNYGRMYTDDDMKVLPVQGEYSGFQKTNATLKDCFAIANPLWKDSIYPVSDAFNSVTKSTYVFIRNTADYWSKDYNGSGEPLRLKKDGDKYQGETYIGETIKDIPYNPNDSTRQWKSISAQDDYEQIDSCLQKYYEEKYPSSGLPSPGGTVTFDGSTFTMKWDENPQAKATRVTIKVYDGSGSEIDTYSLDVTGTSLSVDAYESWYGEGNYAKVSLQYVSADTENNGVYTSDKFDLSYRLATPKVYMQLTGTIDNREYTYVLENADDYADTENVQIYVSYTGTADKIKFPASVGSYSEQDKNTTNIKPNKNTIFTCRAQQEDNAGKPIAKSASIGVQTAILNTSILKSKSDALANDNDTAWGFKGATPETLSYNLALKGAKEDRGVIYRSDLMAYDKNLGIDVGISSAIGRLSHNIPVDMVLEKIPEQYSLGSVLAAATVSLQNINTGGISGDPKNIVNGQINEGNGVKWWGTPGSNENSITIEYQQPQPLESVSVMWSGGRSYTYKLAWYDENTRKYDLNQGNDFTVTQDETQNNQEKWKDYFLTDSDKPAEDVKVKKLVIYNIRRGDNGNIAIQEVQLNSKENPSHVRAYPWRSQNDIVQYAWEVKAGLSAQEVKEQYMTNGILNEGYSVSLDEDGKYQVIYSRFFTKDNNGYIYAGVIDRQATLNKAPAPALAETCTYEGGKYQFAWNQDIPNDTSTYHVVLKGQKLNDDRQVVLYQSTTHRGNTLAVNGSGWDYSFFTLSVTKPGETTGADGFLKLMGSRAEEDYKVKLPLNQITMPSADIKGKEGLIYEISWKGIPDSLEAQRDALAGYAVYGRIKQDGQEDKSILLKDMDNPTGDDVDYSADPYTTTIWVDMENYDEIPNGATVYLSVQAIALENDEFYHHGPKGLERTLTLPKRIDTPEVEQMSLTLAPVEEGASDSLTDADNNPITVTRDAFENSGFLFTIKNDALRDKPGSYVFQTMVYDTAPVFDGEGNLTENPVGYYNGSEVVKEECTVTMPDDALNLASYNLTGISSDYAGKYLIFRAKATAASEISSLWSEYYCLQIDGGPYVPLPNVQLETPYTQWGSVSATKDVTTGDTQAGRPVAQDTVTWSQIDYADGYKISLYNLASDPKGYYDITLKLGDTGYQMQLPGMPDNQWITIEEKDELASAEGVKAAYSAPLQGNSYEGVEVADYAFTFGGTAAENGIPFNYSIELGAEIQVLINQDDSVTYRIVLPDATLLGTQFIRTGHVLVTALAPEERPYRDSLRDQLIRTWDTTDYSLNEVIIRELAEADKWDMPASQSTNWGFVDKAADIPLDTNSGEENTRESQELYYGSDPDMDMNNQQQEENADEEVTP